MESGSEDNDLLQVANEDARAARTRKRKRVQVAAVALAFVQMSMFGALAVATSGIRTQWAHFSSSDFWDVNVLLVRETSRHSTNGQAKGIARDLVATASVAVF
jgi:hypothetical protein